MPDTGTGTGTSATTKHLTLRCQFCDTWNRIDAARASDRPKCGKCGKPMLLDRPFPLNDETFARTIEGAEVPVLVDFYADWCGPCKAMAPSVDELAATYQGRALVAKLDTERAQQVSQSFNIRSIPTTIVFKAGKEVSRQTGLVPKPMLAKLLDSAL
jgi:thioredoxin 2